MEVLDIDVAASGVQIQPGVLYPLTLSNTVDPVAGTIDFSQISFSGGGTNSNFTGQGTFATITFKAKAVGSSPVTFDFTPNSSTDTNVASVGSDILSSVVNGNYTVVESVTSTSETATLSSSPTSSTINTGEVFVVTIKLDTHGNNTDGVEISSLNFNPSVLEVLYSNSSTAGIQIQPGELYPTTLINSVDNASGKIDFSQITTGGGNFNGSGTLAVVTFRAKSAGSSALTFDFTPNSSTDTNVASVGSDILSSVVNGNYTVKSSGNNGGGGGSSSGGGSSAGAGSSSSGGGGGAGSAPSYGGGTPPPPTPAGGSQYPTIPQQSFTSLRVSGPFSVGITSDQVTVLQRILKQDPTIYPEGITSGYYGGLTRKAVERFQCKHMFLCSGSPSTNGYGLAGPSTRAKINSVFGGVSSSVAVNTYDPQRQEAIQLITSRIQELQIALKSLMERQLEILMAEAAGQ